MQVVKIDLQHNDLKTIPKCLLELPCLTWLNLSHNHLVEIPDTSKWSQHLIELNLGHNRLASLPPSCAVAQSLCSLNLGQNVFQQVPLCICSLTTLHSLNLSDNPDIKTLPAEMGQLTSLAHLNLSGLKHLRDPPQKVQKSVEDCISYLYNKLHNAKPSNTMKLIVLGNSGKGKSLLVAHLEDRDYNDKLTVGVEISRWSYRPSLAFGKSTFLFNTWDFSGLDVYHPLRQCFLSPAALYILVFSLKDGKKGIEELKPWLNSLAQQAPHSRVVIVGTHLDEIAQQQRRQIDALINSVKVVSESYAQKLKVVEVVPVGLKVRPENIKKLKQAIYSHAAHCENNAGKKIMGLMVPESYLILENQLESISEPILHGEELKQIAKDINLEHLLDDDNFIQYVATTQGSLLHYDDHKNKRRMLYFVNPSWLCGIIADILSSYETAPFIGPGIIHFKDVSLLLGHQQISEQHLKQVLDLLSQFGFAVPLDKDKVLLGYALKDKPLTDFNQGGHEPVYQRFITFDSGTKHNEFWIHLLAMLMQYVPSVHSAINKSTPVAGVHKDGEPVTQLLAYSPNSTLIGGAEIHLEYWRTGLYYKDSEVMFQVESLDGSYQLKNQSKYKDGVLVVTSSNTLGRTIFCQLIHLIVSLIGELYPHLREGGESASLDSEQIEPCFECIQLGREQPHLERDQGESTSLKQIAPCFECVKLAREQPFNFPVELIIKTADDKVPVVCGYFDNDATKNHSVDIGDVVPEFLSRHPKNGDHDTDSHVETHNSSYQADSVKSQEERVKQYPSINNSLDKCAQDQQDADRPLEQACSDSITEDA